MRARDTVATLSKIEWTDATWNPVTGCTKITRGCDNCYAERFAERFRGTPGHPYEPGFDLTLRPERLSQPLSWKRPRMIFVNSMSDLFHKDVPTDFIDEVFETMETADWHVFQVLTKRSPLMRDYLRHRYGLTPCSAAYLVRRVRRGQQSHRENPASSRRADYDPVPLHRTTPWACRRYRYRGDILGHRRRRKRTKRSSHEA